MIFHDNNLNEPQVVWGFSKSTKSFPVLSWLISLFQNNLASHSFIRLSVPALQIVVVIDATSHTVRVRPWSNFTLENRMVKGYATVISPEKAMQFLLWGISKSGEKYPVVEIMGNLIQQIVKILTFGKIKIRNPLGQGKKKPRCNELSLLAFKEVFGIHVPPDLDSTDLIFLDEFISKEVSWLKPIVE